MLVQSSQAQQEVSGATLILASFIKRRSNPLSVEIFLNLVNTFAARSRLLD